MGFLRDPTFRKFVTDRYRWAWSLYLLAVREALKVSDYCISLINVKQNSPKKTEVIVSALLCLVTCGEVISQQAADPFCEDTGSEQVVAVVIHCKLGFHLRVKTHGRQLVTLSLTRWILYNERWQEIPERQVDPIIPRKYHTVYFTGFVRLTVTHSKMLKNKIMQLNDGVTYSNKINFPQL